MKKVNLLFLCMIAFISCNEEQDLDLSVNGSPDKPGGLSIQLCKSEKKEFYIRYSS